MTQYELDRVQLSVSARIRNEWSKVSNLLPYISSLKVTPYEALNENGLPKDV